MAGIGYWTVGKLKAFIIRISEAAGAGDITGVAAGDGLTGGGASGDVTLTVGEGAGLTVASETVSVDYSGADSVVKSATDGTSDIVAANDKVIFADESHGSDDVKYANMSQLATYITGSAPKPPLYIIGSEPQADYGSSYYYAQGTQASLNENYPPAANFVFPGAYINNFYGPGKWKFFLASRYSQQQGADLITVALKNMTTGIAFTSATLEIAGPGQTPGGLSTYVTGSLVLELSGGVDPRVGTDTFSDLIAAFYVAGGGSGHALRIKDFSLYTIHDP